MDALINQKFEFQIHDCWYMLSGRGKVEYFVEQYTQGNLFEILLNETEIRLYLLFFDWFGTANERPFAVPN